MNVSLNDNITNYLRTISRNKIVIHKDRISEIHSLDIGHFLANDVITIGNDSKFSLEAKKKLDDKLMATISMLNNKEFPNVFLRSFPVVVFPTPAGPLRIIRCFIYIRK